jgi:hypothetical protein
MKSKVKFGDMMGQSLTNQMKVENSHAQMLQHLNMEDSERYFFGMSSLLLVNQQMQTE